jgi:hypothetical protein
VAKLVRVQVARQFTAHSSMAQNRCLGFRSSLELDSNRSSRRRNAGWQLERDEMCAPDATEVASRVKARKCGVRHGPTMKMMVTKKQRQYQIGMWPSG